MLANRKSLFFFILIFVLLVFFTGNRCLAQDKTSVPAKHKPEYSGVQWIGEWPSSDSLIKKKENKRSITDIILGKRKQELSRPISLIVDGQNTKWILDQENNAIFQVNNASGKIPGFFEKQGNKFSSLVGICSFRKNEFLVTDSYLNKIFLVNSYKKECAVLNKALKLDKPTGIAYSAITDEIWVLETGAHRIVILNSKGDIQRTIGKRGTGIGEFNFPNHIWIDKAGNAYIVDAMNFRVQILNKEGNVISVFGSNGDATGYFASPKGIATDSRGYIYVADALFHVVQIFDINGDYLYTFGSQGQDEGQFWMPAGIYIDESDKIYVADSYNSRIQIFQLITEDKQ